MMLKMVTIGYISNFGNLLPHDKPTKHIEESVLVWCIEMYHFTYGLGRVMRIYFSIFD